jgi:hypothetical protein
MKPIRFSRHASEQMIERGASEAEVISAIRDGEQVPAKQGRQVFAIVAEEPDVLIVVTVYTFYF